MFHHPWNWLAIIHLARSQTAGQQFAPIIDSEVQFKSVKPPHTCLTTLGICRKDAVPTDPFWMTDFKASRVNEADPSAGPISALQIGQQGKQHPRSEEHTSELQSQS